MSLPIRVDMNLSPDWVPFLAAAGWQAVHWSAVGDPRATDQVIMDWARANGHLVFTHDLDFGTLLAVTKADGPSVIQVRTQDIMPATLGPWSLLTRAKPGSESYLWAVRAPLEPIQPVARDPRPPSPPHANPCDT